MSLSDLRPFLMILRRALLAEVAEMERINASNATPLGQYLEVSRRSKLQVVTYIETFLRIKPSKNRRIHKERRPQRTGVGLFQ